MGKQKTKKASMDVDKPKAAKPAAAPAGPPAADDGWTTTPVTQNPFMLQLLGEQGAAALQSTMPAPTPEPATPRGGALGVAGKKIKKQESRKSKLRKAKKSAKATTVSEKLQARAQNEANQKKKKEKWKHLWE